MDGAGLFTNVASAESRGLLAKGKFISKDVIEVGDLVEFRYHGENKYMLVTDPGYEDERMVVKKIHGIDLSHITLDDLLRILEVYDQLGTVGMKFDNKRIDSKVFYNMISDITKKTRSYRTYIFDDVTRTRIMQYAKIGVTIV